MDKYLKTSVQMGAYDPDYFENGKKDDWDIPSEAFWGDLNEALELDEELLIEIGATLLESIVLVHVECDAGKIKDIKVLKNDGIVYSVSSKSGNYNYAINEKDIINAISKCDFLEVKKWVNSWYEFLIDHISRIKEDNNYNFSSDNIQEENMKVLYYVKAGRLIELGSYSENTVYRSLNDSEALKIIRGIKQEEFLFWEGSCNTEDNTIYPGKDKCNFLRDVRKKIAEVNNIEYEPAECHHKGPCMGTCPVCDREIKYIDDALQNKILNGEEVVLNGISEEDLQNAVNGNGKNSKKDNMQD